MTACKRTHTIDKYTLTAELYFECLGPPKEKKEVQMSAEGEMVQDVDMKTQPIFLDDLQSDKLSYLFRFEKLKSRIQAKMDDVYSHIKWPPSENGFISIECTLQKGTPNYDLYANNWAGKAKCCFLESFNALHIQHHNTPNSIWKNVQFKLMLLDYKEESDVDVILLNEKCTIYVVGSGLATTKMSMNIVDIIEEENRILQKETEKDKETLPLQT